MIDFPSSTIVHRRIPKEAFYQHLHLTRTLKDKFISDVDHIMVENSLTKENLNLAKTSSVKEILLLSVTLKKQEFDSKIVEAIAKQNPHKLIFLLIYNNNCQLAVYRNKLYRTEWMNQDKISLTLNGNTIDEIWDDIIRQIAITSDVIKDEDKPIEDQLKQQDEINRLIILIDKTEKETWKEEQPKKKFELSQRLQKYKRQLEELTNGKA